MVKTIVPYKCLDELLKHPPLVIFLLSLLCLTLTALLFALKYDNDKENVLIDTDRKLEWKELTKRFSGMDLCKNTQKGEPLNSVNNNNGNFVNSGNLSEETTVEAYITIDWKQLKNLTAVEAIFIVEKWHMHCPADYDVTVKFVVNFDLTEPTDGASISSTEEMRVCALIKGPKKLMPKYEDPICDYNSDNNRAQVARFISRRTTKDASFCPDGIQTRFQFTDNSYGKQFAIYLSEEARFVIIMRMLYFAAILAIITVFCCIVLCCTNFLE